MIPLSLLYHHTNCLASAATQRGSPLIVVAAIAIAIVLILLLRPMRFGIIDVLRHYKIIRIEEKVIHSAVEGLIAFLLTFIILFSPLAFGGVDLWAVAVLELAILLLFFLHVLHMIRDGTIWYKKNILNTLFFVFILGIIAQLLMGTSSAPYRTFVTLKTVVLYYALFFVIVNRVQRRREIDHIMARITVAGLLVSTIALLQVVTGTDKIYWIRRPPAPVFFGPFTYWNHFSCYVALAALLTLGTLCYRILRSGNITWHAPEQAVKDLINVITDPRVTFPLLSFTVMVTAIFLARSRATILCFIAVLAYFLASLTSKSYARKVIAVFLFGLLVAFLVVAFFLVGTSTGADKIISELQTVFSPKEYAFRVSLYTIDAPKIFKAHPFFGIGLASMHDVLPLYLSGVNVHGWGHTPGVYEVAVIPRYIFNDTLQLLLEMGLIVFLILATLFVRFLITSVRSVRKSVSRYQYVVGMAVISAFLFFGMHSSIDYDVWLSSLSSLFTIMLSLALLISHLSGQGGDSEITLEQKTIAVINGKKQKKVFFLSSTVVFVYFAFIISRPLVVNVLTREGTTLSSFHKALAIDQSNDELHRIYHKFLLDQHKKGLVEKEAAFRDAEAAIDKAIQLNPYKTSYLITKGDFELRRKRYEDAAFIYQKAARMEPNNPVIQMGCAAVIFWQAIHERDAYTKGVLMKKGELYYSKARALSAGQISLSSIVKNKKVYSRLVESLKKEGLAVR